MEMGVDIGGISAVVMNNVFLRIRPTIYSEPGVPGVVKSHHALFRTPWCKGNPHDQQVLLSSSTI